MLHLVQPLEVPRTPLAELVLAKAADAGEIPRAFVVRKCDPEVAVGEDLRRLLKERPLS